MFKVLDFTKRLPGPYASYLLAGQGLDVTKVEIKNFQDPFLNEISKGDDSFSQWYKSLNAQKNIFHYDGENQNALKKLIHEADIILHDFQSDDKKNLYYLNEAKNPCAILKLMAYKNTVAAHDINALAKLGLLKLHLANQTNAKRPSYIAPPLIPLAGVSFGSGIALKAITLLLQAKEKNEVIENEISLIDQTEFAMAPFNISGRSEFLHNGLYPCYGIYALKDGHIVLGPIEEKFWNKFIELFDLQSLNLSPFETDKNGSFKRLANFFFGLTKEMAQQKLGDAEICIDII